MATNRVIWRLVFGLLIAITIFLSLSPKSQMPSLPVSDKLGHFLTYLTLGVSGTLAARQLKRTYLLGLLAVLACLLEGLQSLVPGRSPGLADALASSFGAAAGIFLVGLVISRSSFLARDRKAGSTKL